ncbi:MAG: M48 family metalloprotease [Campylobacteraceae bacterium]|jgi:Zn-dependent protease with chaperone function|nr:M48 family metalloprotease [Campylobacteraceae bacterium]
MNFYEEQDKSRRYSIFLMLIFALSVIIVVFTVGMIFITIYVYTLKTTDYFTLSPFYILNNADIFIIICSFLSVFFVIACGVVKKIDDLEKGGHVIANELGGRLLLTETINKKEKTLMKVVEEMSIASGISSLPIYIIESKHINAFVAGTTYDNAVFGITRGAVNLLERDELQGVIAHEFSHIFNGDMRLNNYIAGCINGITYIFAIGMEFIFPSVFDKYQGKDMREVFLGNGSPLLLICGFAMTFLGSIGMACASCIQLLMNHQREFLADAFAVQFTRYPSGIANALKKVGRYGYKLPSTNVGYHSHMFFASWSSPATDKRILKIEPKWNGEYMHINKKQKEAFKEPMPKKNVVQDVLSVAYILNQLADIGSIDAKQLSYARKVLDLIPQNLKQSARNPLEAEFIIYALLLDSDADTRNIQAELIAYTLFSDNSQKQETARRRLHIIYESISFLERLAYLNLIHICITALKSMSLEQYILFKKLSNELIKYDGHICVFEWCIKYIVLYPLDITFGFKKLPLETHTHIGALKKELEILFSAVSYVQCKNDNKAAIIYETTKKQSEISSLQYIPYSEFSQEDFAKAIDEIQNSKPFIRRKVMELIILFLSHDNEICYKDLAVIHALSEALHLPLGIRA